jgi:hypothetical protein
MHSMKKNIVWRGKDFSGVNGKKGKSFQMERVVCQRCPIAPYLYFFVVDVLGYMIVIQDMKLKG